MSLDLLKKVAETAATRGMRVSRAATRLGLDPGQAKACSVASEVEFLTDEESMVEVARSVANSCMSGVAAEGYRYWARAETRIEQGPVIRPVAVAVYRNSRCLVRLDTREFIKCYGPQSGDLHRALVFLEFRWNEKALNDLMLPKAIQIGVEFSDFRVTKRDLVDDPACLVENVRREAFGLPARKVFRLDFYAPSRVIFQTRLAKYAPRPYSDGLRKHL